MQNEGEVSPEAIRRGLSQMVYEGISGTITYRGSGDPVKSAVILQIKDGAVNFHKIVGAGNN